MRFRSFCWRTFEEHAGAQTMASEQHLVLDDVQVERPHDAHGPLPQLSAPPGHALHRLAAPLQCVRPDMCAVDLWS